MPIFLVIVVVIVNYPTLIEALPTKGPRIWNSLPAELRAPDGFRDI